MKSVLKISCLLLILTITKKNTAQGFYLIQNTQNNFESIYLKTNTTWIAPTPFAFRTNRFSPDYGKTWEKVGMFGGNLRPYLQDNQDALNNLNSYTTFRILGAFQMFVLAPYFIYKDINWTNQLSESGTSFYDAHDPGYFWWSLGFLYSGAITYHILAKVFLKNSLFNYYSEDRSMSHKNKFIPRLGLGYDSVGSNPTFSVNWVF